jgi:hypothetical protein
VTNDPPITLPRSLVLGAVDLRAVAWNALVWVPTLNDPKNGWDYFWEKLHRLRDSVNEPEHELIRAAYAASFPNAGRSATAEPRTTLDRTWQIVQPDSKP